MDTLGPTNTGPSIGNDIMRDANDSRTVNYASPVILYVNSTAVPPSTSSTSINLSNPELTVVWAHTYSGYMEDEPQYYDIVETNTGKTIFTTRIGKNIPFDVAAYTYSPTATIGAFNQLNVEDFTNYMFARITRENALTEWGTTSSSISVVSRFFTNNTTTSVNSFNAVFPSHPANTFSLNIFNTNGSNLKSGYYKPNSAEIVLLFNYSNLYKSGTDTTQNKIKQFNVCNNDTGDIIASIVPNYSNALTVVDASSLFNVYSNVNSSFYAFNSQTPQVMGYMIRVKNSSYFNTGTIDKSYNIRIDAVRAKVGDSLLETVVDSSPAVTIFPASSLYGAGNVIPIDSSLVDATTGLYDNLGPNLHSPINISNNSNLKHIAQRSFGQRDPPSVNASIYITNSNSPITSYYFTNDLTISVIRDYMVNTLLNGNPNLDPAFSESLLSSHSVLYWRKFNNPLGPITLPDSPNNVNNFPGSALYISQNIPDNEPTLPSPNVVFDNYAFIAADTIGINSLPPRSQLPQCVLTFYNGPSPALKKFSPGVYLMNNDSEVGLLSPFNYDYNGFNFEVPYYFSVIKPNIFSRMPINIMNLKDGLITHEGTTALPSTYYRKAGPLTVYDSNTGTTSQREYPQTTILFCGGTYAFDGDRIRLNQPVAPFLFPRTILDLVDVGYDPTNPLSFANTFNDGQLFYYGNIVYRNVKNAIPVMQGMPGRSDPVVMPNVTLYNSFILTENLFKGNKTIQTVAIREHNGLTTIKSLPAGVFSGCTNMVSISPAFKLIDIGVSAFSDCTAFRGNTDISGTKVLQLTSATTLTIQDDAFMNCSSMTSINLQSTGDMTIGSMAFANCTNLTSITISTTGTLYIDSSSFNDCNNVTICNINAKLFYRNVVKTIGSTKINSFSISSIISNFFNIQTISISSVLDSGLSLMTRILPSSLVSLSIDSPTLALTCDESQSIFNSISNLRTLNISNITDITMPTSYVATLPVDMFVDCPVLTTVVMKCSSPALTKNYSINNIHATAIDIQDINSTCNFNFDSCPALISIKCMCLNLTRYGNQSSYLFNGSPHIQSVNLHGLTYSTFDINGEFASLASSLSSLNLMFNTSTTTITNDLSNFSHLREVGIYGNTVIFPSPTTIIPYSNMNITTLRLGIAHLQTVGGVIPGNFSPISSTITTLEVNPEVLSTIINQLTNVTNLSIVKLTAANMSNIVSLPTQVLNNLNKLDLSFDGLVPNLNFISSLTSGPLELVLRFNGYAQVDMQSVRHSRYLTVYGNITLKSSSPIYQTNRIVVNGNATIADNFVPSDSFTSLIISGDAYIGRYAFRGSYLNNISINGNANINDYGFYGTSVPLTAFFGGITTLGISSFADSRLETITFSNSLDIPHFCFMNASLLTTIVFNNGNTVTSISTGAFFGCTRLTSIPPLSSSVDEVLIGDFAFVNSGIAGNVVIPVNANYGSSIFVSCPGITSITYNCDVGFFNNPTVLNNDYLNSIQNIMINNTILNISGGSVIKIAPINSVMPLLDISYNSTTMDKTLWYDSVNNESYILRYNQLKNLQKTLELINFELHQAVDAQAGHEIGTLVRMRLDTTGAFIHSIGTSFLYKNVPPDLPSNNGVWNQTTVDQMKEAITTVTNLLQIVRGYCTKYIDSKQLPLIDTDILAAVTQVHTIKSTIQVMVDSLTARYNQALNWENKYINISIGVNRWLGALNAIGDRSPGYKLATETEMPNNYVVYLDIVTNLNSMISNLDTLVTTYNSLKTANDAINNSPTNLLIPKIYTLNSPTNAEMILPNKMLSMINVNSRVDDNGSVIDNNLVCLRNMPGVPDVPCIVYDGSGMTYTLEDASGNGINITLSGFFTIKLTNYMYREQGSILVYLYNNSLYNFNYYNPITFTFNGPNATIIQSLDSLVSSTVNFNSYVTAITASSMTELVDTTLNFNSSINRLILDEKCFTNGESTIININITKDKIKVGKDIFVGNDGATYNGPILVNNPEPPVIRNMTELTLPNLIDYLATTHNVPASSITNINIDQITSIGPSIDSSGSSPPTNPWSDRGQNNPVFAINCEVDGVEKTIISGTYDWFWLFLVKQAAGFTHTADQYANDPTWGLAPYRMDTNGNTFFPVPSKFADNNYGFVNNYAPSYFFYKGRKYQRNNMNLNSTTGDDGNLVKLHRFVSASPDAFKEVWVSVILNVVDMIGWVTLPLMFITPVQNLIIKLPSIIQKTGQVFSKVVRYVACKSAAKTVATVAVGLSEKSLNYIAALELLPGISNKVTLAQLERVALKALIADMKNTMCLVAGVARGGNSSLEQVARTNGSRPVLSCAEPVARASTAAARAAIAASELVEGTNPFITRAMQARRAGGLANGSKPVTSTYGALGLYKSAGAPGGNSATLGSTSLPASAAAANIRQGAGSIATQLATPVTDTTARGVLAFSESVARQTGRIGDALSSPGASLRSISARFERSSRRLLRSTTINSENSSRFLARPNTFNRLGSANNVLSILVPEEAAAAALLRKTGVSSFNAIAQNGQRIATGAYLSTTQRILRRLELSVEEFNVLKSNSVRSFNGALLRSVGEDRVNIFGGINTLIDAHIPNGDRLFRILADAEESMQVAEQKLLEFTARASSELRVSGTTLLNATETEVVAIEDSIQDALDAINSARTQASTFYNIFNRLSSMPNISSEILQIRDLTTGYLQSLGPFRQQIFSGISLLEDLGRGLLNEIPASQRYLNLDAELFEANQRLSIFDRINARLTEIFAPITSVLPSMPTVQEVTQAAPRLVATMIPLAFIGVAIYFIVTIKTEEYPYQFADVSGGDVSGGDVSGGDVSGGDVSGGDDDYVFGHPVSNYEWSYGGVVTGGGSSGEWHEWYNDVYVIYRPAGWRPPPRERRAISNVGIDPIAMFTVSSQMQYLSNQLIRFSDKESIAEIVDTLLLLSKPTQSSSDLNSSLTNSKITDQTATLHQIVERMRIAHCYALTTIQSTGDGDNTQFIVNATVNEAINYSNEVNTPEYIPSGRPIFDYNKGYKTTELAYYTTMPSTYQVDSVNRDFDGSVGSAQLTASPLLVKHQNHTWMDVIPVDSVSDVNNPKTTPAYVIGLYDEKAGLVRESTASVSYLQSVYGSSKKVEWPPLVFDKTNYIYLAQRYVTYTDVGPAPANTRMIPSTDVRINSVFNHSSRNSLAITGDIPAGALAHVNCTDVTLTSNSIGAGALYGNTAPTVIINPSLDPTLPVEIGDNALAGMTNLNELTIPSDATLGQNILNGTDNISTVTIANTDAGATVNSALLSLLNDRNVTLFASQDLMPTLQSAISVYDGITLTAVSDGDYTLFVYTLDFVLSIVNNTELPAGKSKFVSWLTNGVAAGGTLFNSDNTTKSLVDPVFGINKFTFLRIQAEDGAPINGADEVTADGPTYKTGWVLQKQASGEAAVVF